MSLVALKPDIGSRKNILFGFLFFINLLAGLYCLGDYMPWHSINFCIAICGLPIIIAGSVSTKPNYRFIIMGLITGLASFFVRINTVAFLTLVFCCMGIIEVFYGKMSAIPLFIILLLSPLSYIIAVFSFPIRLWLTDVAAIILNLTGASAVSSGNIIIYGGNNYSVDPACMGLKMLATSLWLSLYLLHFTQKIQQRYLKFHAIIAMLCMVFVLNAVTNLARIVLLVYFNIPPVHIMHDITGLGCFIVYTVMPAILLLKWLVKLWGKQAIATTPVVQKKNYTFLLVPLATLFIILLSAYNTKISSSPTQAFNQNNIGGYACDKLSTNVIRLKKDNVLIYLKAIPAFYLADHNPLMCWIGSGYEFEQLRETRSGKVNIYSGILKNKEDILYTAWWYDNGQNHTISQLDWRWDMLTGSSGYAVVNVTCNTQAELNKEVEALLKNHLLNAIIASDAAAQ